jgi:hypothetical protein
MTAGSRVLLLVVALLGAAACRGETVDGHTNGHAEIASRSTLLSVGDTMTLSPGILYNDGRWVPLTDVTLTVGDPEIAEMLTSRILRGKKVGLAVVTLHIPQVGSISKNFSIIP